MYSVGRVSAPPRLFARCRSIPPCSPASSLDIQPILSLPDHDDPNSRTPLEQARQRIRLIESDIFRTIPIPANGGERAGIDEQASIGYSAVFLPKLNDDGHDDERSQPPSNHQ